MANVKCKTETNIRSKDDIIQSINAPYYSANLVKLKKRNLSGLALYTIIVIFADHFKKQTTDLT